MAQNTIPASPSATVVPFVETSKSELKSFLDKLGIPQNLSSEFCTKMNVSTLVQFRAKMEEYSFTGVSGIKSIFDKNFDASANQMHIAALAGCMRASLILKENLAGVTDSREQAKIIGTVIYRHLTKFEGPVYIEGQTNKPNIPFVAIMGMAELGFSKLKEQTGDPKWSRLQADYIEFLKPHLRVNTSLQKTEDRAKSVYDALNTNRSELESFFLATMVKCREISEDKSYSTDDLNRLAKTIGTWIEGAPKRAGQYTDALSDERFKKKLRSKMDEPEEIMHLQRYLIYYLGQQIISSPLSVSEKTITAFMDSNLWKYIGDNALAYIGYTQSVSGKKHIEMIRLATAPLLPQLGYLSDSKKPEDQIIFKTLMRQLLDYSLNRKMSDAERTAKLSKWQDEVLASYNSLLPQGLRLNLSNKGEKLLAYLFLPEQFEQATTIHGERWKAKLVDSLGSIASVFGVQPDSVLHMFETESARQSQILVQGSEFFKSLAQKGYKKEEIFWAALDLIPTLSDLAIRSKPGDNPAKVLLDSLSSYVPDRNTLKKSFSELPRQLRTSETEREYMAQGVRNYLVEGLNRKYVDATASAMADLASYLGLPLEKELTAQNAVSGLLASETFKSSRLFTMLKASGYSDQSIATAAFLALSSQTIQTTFMKYKNAAQILDAAMQNVDSWTYLMSKDAARLVIPSTAASTIVGSLEEGIDKVLKGTTQGGRRLDSTLQAQMAAPEIIREENLAGTVQLNSRKLWDLTPNQLCDALFFGAGALDTQMKCFRKQMKEGTVTPEGDIKAQYGEARFRLTSDTVNAEQMNRALAFYSRELGSWNYDKITRAVDSNPVYATVFDVAKAKVDLLFPNYDAEQKKTEITKWFVAEFAKINKEYSGAVDLTIEQINLRLTQPISTPIRGPRGIGLPKIPELTPAILRQMLSTPGNGMQEYLSASNLTFVLIRDGKIMETLGTKKGETYAVGSDLEWKKLRPSDYIAVLDGEQKLLGFNTGINYALGFGVDRKHWIFKNGDQKVVLTMYNITAKGNGFEIKLTPQPERPSLRTNVVTNEALKTIPGIGRDKLILREQQWTTPLSIRTLRASAPLPVIFPPIMSSTEFNTRMNIIYDPSALPNERVKVISLAKVLTAWGIPTQAGEGGSTALEIKNRLIEMVDSNVLPMIKDKLPTQIGQSQTFFINDAFGSVTLGSTSASDYLKLVITKTETGYTIEKFGVEGYDKGNSWVFSGIIESNKLVVQKILGYSFLSAEIFRMGLPAGWSMSTSLNVGIPMKLSKVGPLWLPSGIAKDSKFLVMPSMQFESPRYRLSGDWTGTFYGGYIFGSQGTVFGGADIQRNIGNRLTFSAGAGISNKTPSPYIGVMAGITNSIAAGGGLMFDPSNGLGGYGRVKISRVGFTLSLASLAMTPGLAAALGFTYYSDEGKAYSLQSLIPSTIVKGIKNIRGRKRKYGA
ncbi:MAG: hypothetical protein WC488_02075 [Candidatus Micrarchaeia archaeon]